MARRNQETSMGGSARSFQTTRWTQIRRAQTGDEQQRQIELEAILSKYWKPVYCCLRRKGHNNEHAKDLTQAFFLEVVLGDELIQKASQTKGRFRTFLLTTLDRYSISDYRRESSVKRLPKGGVAHLDTAALSETITDDSTITPDLAFHRAWAADLLATVIATVRDEYYSTDRATYWEVFRARVLDPILMGAKDMPMPELCERYGIDDQKTASNMVVTVKRRFATAIRQEIRLYVQSDEEAEDEFRELLKVLSEGCAE